MLPLRWGVIVSGPNGYEISVITVGAERKSMFYDRDPEMDMFVTGCQPILPPMMFFHNKLPGVLIIVSSESLKLLPNYKLANITFA
jgi:hypothetical protein